MKLSIITINFNNKDGLKKTIDSVVNQTWHDFEWIVIDGGSTDGSKELIEQYRQHFAYWCSEPDGGIYQAMNKGIDHAQGEFLQFLNSGDCLHGKDVLEKVDQKNKNVDILAAVSVSQETGEPMKIFKQDILHQLLYDSLNHQATFIRRSLFDKHRYNEDNIIVSDWEFFFQSIIIEGCSYEYSDIIVVDFNTHGISNQPTYLQKQIEERSYVLGKYLGPYVQKDLRDYFNIREEYEYLKKYKQIEKQYPYLTIIFLKITSWLTILSKLFKNKMQS